MDQVNARREAAIFFKWIQDGRMTLDQARADLLITDAQRRLLQRHMIAHHYADASRKLIWTALLSMLGQEVKP